MFDSIATAIHGWVAEFEAADSAGTDTIYSLEVACWVLVKPAPGSNEAPYVSGLVAHPEVVGLSRAEQINGFIRYAFNLSI
jgi:hypothetical protein